MINSVKDFLRYWLPVILYCLLIFNQSGQPAVDVPLPEIPHMDKLMHAGAYALLGALLLRAFKAGTGAATTRLIILSISLATLYGLSDEIHQSFIPARQADILDLLADFIGAVAGVLGYGKFHKKTRP